MSTIRQKVRDGLRRFAARVQTRAARERHDEHARRRERSIFKDLVEKMTNHERNLWAKAGYPGLHSNNLGGLMPFAKAAEARIRHGIGRKVR